MKIAVISTACYRKYGGLAQETWQSALEFTRLGHTVHLIMPLDYLDEYQLPHSDVIIHRVKVHKLSISEYKGIDVQVSLMRQLLTLPKLFAYVLKVTMILKRIRPDIVQTKGIMDALPSYFAKCLFNIPYTLTMHGNPGDKGSNMVGIPHVSKCTQKYWGHFPQFKSADAVITLTSQSYNSVLELFGRQSLIIPDGVDGNKFTPDFSKRCDANVSLKLISIGTLSTMKGFEYAIKAMSTIVKVIPHAHLTIIGNGPLWESHLKLIQELNLEDHVTLFGKLPHHQIVEHLQSSHILLLPSIGEGFSLVLLEAMACGLPVIGTPVSVVPDIVSEWHNGYLVPYRDPDAISMAVIRMFSSNELDEFSLRSVDAAKRYSWTTVAQKYVDVFDDIVRQNKKSV